MHLVQNWFRERRRQFGGIIQKGEPHERNPCAPSLEEQPLEEASLQEDCESKAAWNLARKCASSSGTLNYVLFFCEGVKDTKDCTFIVYSVASMHNDEQGDLSSDTMKNTRRSKTSHKRHTATGDSANKRVSTSLCSRFRSVRNSAITRWNVSDSVALSAVLKTRIFIWVENGETPQLAQNGKTISCIMDNSRLSSYSQQAFCLQHRDERISPTIPENWDRS